MCFRAPLIGAEAGPENLSLVALGSGLRSQLGFGLYRLLVRKLVLQLVPPRGGLPGLGRRTEGGTYFSWAHVPRASEAASCRWPPLCPPFGS